MQSQKQILPPKQLLIHHHNSFGEHDLLPLANFEVVLLHRTVVDALPRDTHPIHVLGTVQEVFLDIDDEDDTEEEDEQPSWIDVEEEEPIEKRVPPKKRKFVNSKKN